MNSYSDSEDEVSNVSDHHENSRHVHYADSSITSTNSDVSEFEKCLDDAIDNLEDVDMDRCERRGNTVSEMRFV